MLYIVTALKSEAQAFVDKYKLRKTKLNNFTIFSNSSLTIIVSGIGIINSKNATQVILDNFNTSRDDIFLNIGICGANKEFNIGELIIIDTISYKDEKILINKSNINNLTCVDEGISFNMYRLVDMESFGFYSALVSSHVNKIYILKVVSDHFEPSKVTKEFTKSLIFNVIDDINKIIFKEVRE